MRTLTRALPLALAAALLILFAVACSSGGDQTVGDDGSGDSSGDLVSATPLEALSASGERFQEEVESLQMELEFTINAGGFVVDTSASMAFQAPDQMHLTTDVTGLGTFEMLVLGSDIYVNIPLQGWIVFSLDDLSLGEFLDTESFQDMFTDHSLVDYAALIESVGGDVEDLGEETVDGNTYRHYAGTLDFADLTAAFSDAFGTSEGIDLEDVSGPLTFDAWVDPDTFLPYKLTASGEFPFGAGAMVFDASMLFSSYNEVVEIPGRPPDAIPFTLLGGP